MPKKQSPNIILLILDGFGIAEDSKGNAIARAKTPTFDFLVHNYPTTSLMAASSAVGMPFGENGNSEVGHFAIGSGRIYPQSVTQITNTIEDGSFFNNPVLLDAARHVQKYNSSVHIIGLVSPGGLHGYDEHVIALIKFAKEQGLEKVFVHMITDGEDTHTPALETYRKIEKAIKKYNTGAVATLFGRFTAMDRAQHWDRTQEAWDALVSAKGDIADSAEAALEHYQKSGIPDNLVPPTVISKYAASGRIKSNDAIIFTNYRPERMAQIARSFADTHFDKFPRPNAPENLFIVTMTEYFRDLPLPVVFKRDAIPEALGEVLDKNGIAHLHIAETEKAAHVKLFFNAMRLEPFQLEKDVILPSPPTREEYADTPCMATAEIADEIITNMDKKNFPFIVANIASSDMVSHTGNLQSAIQAIECIDKNLSQIYKSARENNYTLVITADHGNAEELLNPDGTHQDTEHSTNPVPFILINDQWKKETPYRRISDLAMINPIGGLFDVAPTLLDIMRLPKPEEMSGTSLLETLTSSQ